MLIGRQRFTAETLGDEMREHGVATQDQEARLWSESGVVVW